MSEGAACVRCTNEGCPALVILPAIPDGGRRFDEQKESMEIDCPSTINRFRFRSQKYFSMKLRTTTCLQDTSCSEAFPFRTRWVNLSRHDERYVVTTVERPHLQNEAENPCILRWLDSCRSARKFFASTAASLST